MITEAVLHICPVSQYKTEIGGGKKKEKKNNGKKFFQLIIHVQVSWNIFQSLWRFMSKPVPEVILKTGVLPNESMTLSKKTVHVVSQSAPRLLWNLHFH